MDRPTSSSSSNCRSSSGISSHNSWCSDESVPPPPTPFDFQSPVYDDDDGDEYEFFFTNPCEEFDTFEAPTTTTIPSISTSPLGPNPQGDPCSSSTSYTDTELKQTYDLGRTESLHINAENSWAILRNVSAQGCVLEYIGGPKPSLRDTGGFAQCGFPLTPINHYFEVKVLGPGSHSAVSVGLTCKDYDVNQSLGWCPGSIAYNASNGKLFSGTETGSPFGPCCSENDTIGCGIVFPPNATSSTWWFHNSHALDSSSDDDCNAASSDKVKVFFLMNRNLLGMKEMVLPKSGFYATVAFQRLNERVSVDLNPLTG